MYTSYSGFISSLPPTPPSSLPAALSRAPPPPPPPPPPLSSLTGFWRGFPSVSRLALIIARASELCPSRNIIIKCSSPCSMPALMCLAHRDLTARQGQAVFWHAVTVFMHSLSLSLFLYLFVLTGSRGLYIKDQIALPVQSLAVISTMVSDWDFGIRPRTSTTWLDLIKASHPPPEAVVCPSTAQKHDFHTLRRLRGASVYSELCTCLESWKYPLKCLVRTYYFWKSEKKSWAYTPHSPQHWANHYTPGRNGNSQTTDMTLSWLKIGQWRKLPRLQRWK